MQVPGSRTSAFSAANQRSGPLEATARLAAPVLDISEDGLGLLEVLLALLAPLSTRVVESSSQVESAPGVWRERGRRNARTSIKRPLEEPSNFGCLVFWPPGFVEM